MRVPRWRTRMLPEMTTSPAYFFTPRRCPLLSRPFRTEPPPFLCAIVLLHHNLINLQAGVLLAMPNFRANAFLWLIAEDIDLRAFEMIHHRGAHRSGLHIWGADMDGVAFDQQQNLIQGNRST